jgi:ligand-binding sensor domain-containing protein
MRPPRTHRGALACASLLVALLSAAGLRAPAEQLPVRPYTISDGLAHDEVLHILQDSHGFLWFCAVDGLSRFDGYRFTNYGTKDGLPSSYVNDIIQTRAGEYWVATNEGVSRFNPSAGARTSGALFKNYRIGDELQSSLVSGLYEDSRGQLWAATQGGLFRLEGGDGGAFRRVPIEISARSDRVLEVRTLLEDREGSLWLATGQGLVRRTPDGRAVHYPLRRSESTDFVWSLMIDAGGRIWAGTQSGLLVFTPGAPVAGATDASLAVPEQPEEGAAAVTSPPAGAVAQQQAARPVELPSEPGRPSGSPRGTASRTTPSTPFGRPPTAGSGSARAAASRSSTAGGSAATRPRRA